MIIVRTYTDAGKSGLRIDGRDALKELIRDVENGQADFCAILVYDVSRWGRFQDADESAYYEYICRRAKIAVHYCAEQFENDGSPISTIVKGVKRAMAGEYSRELSAKVFIGQCRLIELGVRQGGSPGFGLRRMLRDVSGQHKGVLNRGEQKSIQTDRVILVPGPPQEVEIVRWMYRMFVEEKIVESKLAKMLNDRGVTTDLGRPWSQGTIHQILTNEKYVGNNVYNRVSFKLKKKRDNISSLGLKRPITVARRIEPIDGKPYDLVCGQGRLEAFMALGQVEIPAIVKEVSREECFLMSLVENIARRQIRPLELLKEIESLKSRGYNTSEIAKKIDVTKNYVVGITHLLKNGEERFLHAVDKGRIPLSVAMQIASADEDGIQQALCQAYEDQTLRGRKLLTVRRIRSRWQRCWWRQETFRCPMRMPLWLPPAPTCLSILTNTK